MSAGSLVVCLLCVSGVAVFCVSSESLCFQEAERMSKTWSQGGSGGRCFKFWPEAHEFYYLKGNLEESSKFLAFWKSICLPKTHVHVLIYWIDDDISFSVVYLLSKMLPVWFNQSVGCFRDKISNDAHPLKACVCLYVWCVLVWELSCALQYKSGCFCLFIFMLHSLGKQQNPTFDGNVQKCTEGLHLLLFDMSWQLS